MTTKEYELLNDLVSELRQIRIILADRLTNPDNTVVPQNTPKPQADDGPYGHGPVSYFRA